MTELYCTTKYSSYGGKYDAGKCSIKLDEKTFTYRAGANIFTTSESVSEDACIELDKKYPDLTIAYEAGLKCFVKPL